MEKYSGVYRMLFPGANNYSYPVDFFKGRLAGSRPPMTISVPDVAVNLDRIRTSVYRGIANEKLTLKEAIYYIYSLMNRVSNVSDSEWKSYGVTIASEGAQVKPFDLVELTTVSETFEDLTTGTDRTERDDAWMLIFICLIYKFNCDDFKDYRGAEWTKAMKVMRNNNCTLSNLSPSTLTGKYINWIYNDSYRRVIAVLDMYFNKYKNEIFSICRIGTSGSRYRHCGALSSCLFVSEITGLDLCDYVKWWITSSLSVEEERMFKKDEEFDQSDSYFMYQIDMGLVSRSAYTVKVNPVAYYVSNMIAAMLGNVRGQRARYYLSTDWPGNFYNALLIAYVFRKYGPATPSTSAAPASAQMREGSLEPTNLNRQAWLNYAAQTKTLLTHPMIQELKLISSSIVEARDGTIGHFLKFNQGIKNITNKLVNV